MRRFGQHELGVSPVVGSILILAIMIVSIGGILTWGMPAIQGLQDHAEYQSVLTQFLQLDSDVRNLRDPLNTRVSTISVSQGTIALDAGDRWVISAARDANYNDFHVLDYEDTTT